MMDLEEQNDRPGGTMSDETADETKDVPEDGRNGEAHGVRRKTVAIIVAVVVVALVFLARFSRVFDTPISVNPSVFLVEF